MESSIHTQHYDDSLGVYLYIDFSESCLLGKINVELISLMNNFA